MAGKRGRTGTSMVSAGRRPRPKIPEYNKDTCPDCKAGARQPCVEYIPVDGRFRVKILQTTHRTGNRKAPGSSPDQKRRQPLTWVPVFESDRRGKQLTLKGEARTKLTDQITAPGKLDVVDRRRKTVGKINSVFNDRGELTVLVILADPEVQLGSKFLLGLARRGRHVVKSLYEAADLPGDKVPVEKRQTRFVGMLGEDL
ncbi:hypothetical protein [Arthrobacter sp. IK3]|uniref:hypothetical protein n=1 Tax=Arthrobacter sp. IK3 TaxID=3448169 RepID=UPI003EE2BAEB